MYSEEVQDSISTYLANTKTRWHVHNVWLWGNLYYWRLWRDRLYYWRLGGSLYYWTTLMPTWSQGCRLRLATCDSETCGLQGVSVLQARQTQPCGFGRRIHSSVEVTELVPINNTNSVALSLFFVFWKHCRSLWLSTFLPSSLFFFLSLSLPPHLSLRLNFST